MCYTSQKREDRRVHTHALKDNHVLLAEAAGFDHHVKVKSLATFGHGRFESGVQYAFISESSAKECPDTLNISVEVPDLEVRVNGEEGWN